MKILFLSQRVPFPPNRGDKITTWRLIERMSRQHEVTVVAFAHDDGDMEAAAQLRAKGIETIAIRHDEKRKKLTALPRLFTRSPLTLGVYGSRELQAEVDARIDTMDMAYAFSSSMGAFLLPHSTPWVMHFAELDSDKWRQYADKQGFPMSWVYRRECKTLERYEGRIAKATTDNVFCTPLELEIFEKTFPGQRGMVIRNGVDLEHYRPAPEKAEPGHLVFTGVMDYYPNVDGCQHFVSEILPRVRAEFPDARFSIVGARPTPECLKLANTQGVTVTGFVDDTRDWLERAAVAVAPLRIARGIQNKVLEALSMGLPTVGTTCATQGVEGISGRHFLVADSAQEQAAMIRGLLRDPDRARQLGAAGRRFVEERYEWEVALDPLEGILQRVAEGHASPGAQTSGEAVSPPSVLQTEQQRQYGET